MGLLDTISSLWKSLVGDDLSSFSKERHDDTATVTVKCDTRAEREEANVETEAAVKESVEETESADRTAGKETDAESHAGDEDTRDDTEVAADIIEEAEPEGETVELEPEFESGVEVEVGIDGEPEVEGEPELEDEDKESDGAEVEDEESDDKTADNTDAPTVGRVRSIDLTYAERLSGIDVEAIANLAVTDADEVGDEINVPPKYIQRWIDCAGGA